MLLLAMFAVVAQPLTVRPASLTLTPGQRAAVHVNVKPVRVEATDRHTILEVASNGQLTVQAPPYSTNVSILIRSRDEFAVLQLRVVDASRENAQVFPQLEETTANADNTLAAQTAPIPAAHHTYEQPNREITKSREEDQRHHDTETKAVPGNNDGAAKTNRERAKHPAAGNENSAATLLPVHEIATHRANTELRIHQEPSETICTTNAYETTDDPSNGAETKRSRKALVDQLVNEIAKTPANAAIQLDPATTEARCSTEGSYGTEQPASELKNKLAFAKKPQSEPDAGEIQKTQATTTKAHTAAAQPARETADANTATRDLKENQNRITPHHAENEPQSNNEAAENAKHTSAAQPARLVIGLTQSGASSAQASLHYFLDFYTKRTIHSKLSLWGNIRIASAPQQLDIPVAQFAPDFWKTLGQVEVNKLALAGEFLAGIELHTTRNLGFVAFFGASGAFSDAAARARVFKTAPNQYLGLIPQDRERFYRQYGAGIRHTSPETGTLTATLGQDQAVTAGRYHRPVLRIDTMYPIKRYGLYLFATATLAVAKIEPATNPVAYELAPEIQIHDPRVTLRTIAAARDSYRIGIGIDLMRIFNSR